MKATMYLIQSKTGGKMWWSTEPRDNYDDYTFAEGEFELPEGYKMGEDVMGCKKILNKHDEVCDLSTEEEMLVIYNYHDFEMITEKLKAVSIEK